MIAFSMALENRKNMLSYNRSMPNTKDQNIRGFTLLEVMIAMAILAITLVVVFQSQSQSISMAGRARFETTASLLAQSKMAEIEATDPENVVSDSGDFDDEFPDYSWRVDVTETEIEVLKKIEVKVVNEIMTSNNSFRLVLFR
jgi:general secretion pathway protein I